jgi:RimJ/RimL family protein N-acetyltransferase
VPAPLFHLIRTAEANRWSVSAALTSQQRDRLGDILALEPVADALDALEGHAPVLAGLTVLLTELDGTSTEYRGPALYFAEDLPLWSNDIAEILARPREALTVPELAWIRHVSPDQLPIAVVRSDSGEVVSVCHSARSTPEAAEAGVETARNYRGYGYAPAVVLAWAAAVLDEGRLPLYSTDWTNRASRSVARKLGRVIYGEDCHVTVS